MGRILNQHGNKINPDDNPAVKMGDHGQRFEVQGFHLVSEKWVTIGWAEHNPSELIAAAQRSPKCGQVRILDRRSKNVPRIR